MLRVLYNCLWLNLSILWLYFMACEKDNCTAKWFVLVITCWVNNNLLGESWIKTILAWTFLIHCRETTRRWCGVDRYEIKTLHENHDDGQPRGRIGIKNMLKFMKCTPSFFFAQIVSNFCDCPMGFQRFIKKKFDFFTDIWHSLL